MAGKSVEVYVERLYVHPHVRHGLRSVQQDRNAPGMRDLDYLLYRIDGAKRVGYVGQRNNLCARRDHPLQLVHLQSAVLIDGDYAKDRVALIADHLPWDDIGVVLHCRNEHLIPRPQVFAAKALGDNVDALGSSTSEDDLVPVPRVDVLGYSIPRALVVPR